MKYNISQLKTNLSFASFLMPFENVVGFISVSPCSLPGAKGDPGNFFAKALSSLLGRQDSRKGPWWLSDSANLLTPGAGMQISKGVIPTSPAGLIRQYQAAREGSSP